MPTGTMSILARTTPIHPPPAAPAPASGWMHPAETDVITQRSLWAPFVVNTGEAGIAAPRCSAAILPCKCPEGYHHHTLELRAPDRSICFTDTDTHVLHERYGRYVPIAKDI